MRVEPAAAVARGALRTWGTAGMRRRLAYEVLRRSGRVAADEARWLDHLNRAALALVDARPVVLPAAVTPPVETRIELYGALAIQPAWPEGWHRHPFTQHHHRLTHWTELVEGDPSAGDIKDLWEIGRLTWLATDLRRAAAGDGDGAEACWAHIESFARDNPPFRGPQWMCGQESALRGIVIAFAASALRDHPATSGDRLQLATRLLAETVGRVQPTLGYALSQRNNHAVSEAAFLWTASLLVEGLPDAVAVRERATAALEEVAADQWYPDGSYAQHSPTYQRLAMHGLLWVLAVSRATETPAPAGVKDAVAHSYVFLSSLIDRESGAVPNLGGNDGGLLFAFAGTSISDFRPSLTHAALAVGAEPTGAFEDDVAEARWFGLGANPKISAPPRRGGQGPHHVHRGGRSHLLLRAGPIRHRPAHADQLHVDLWIDGVNVAADAGSYRYTAAAPWQNALADERAHNVPRVPGQAQATRRGRFLWSRWSDAVIVGRTDVPGGSATLAQLTLSGGATLTRLVVSQGDAHVIADQSSDVGALVRWNLPADTAVSCADGRTTAIGPTWHSSFTHSGHAQVSQGAAEDPYSGWSSPTYGVRTPLRRLEVRVDESGRALAWFGLLAQAPTTEFPAEAMQSLSGDALAAAVAQWVERLEHVAEPAG